MKHTKLFEQFISEAKAPYLELIGPDVDGSPGYVQVDLVVTHTEYKDWALARLTPVRNIKGFVLGNLYSSFGEVLDLSVQLKGVRAKLKSGKLVPYSKRAGSKRS